MFAGYILYRVKTPPKIPVVVNLILWSCSLSILFIIVFGVWEGQLSLLMTSLYVSLGHSGITQLTFIVWLNEFILYLPSKSYQFPPACSAWGLALMWITLSCCWGTAKPINSFLSFKGFLPLSRLAYCAYLIHPTVMMITSFQNEAPNHLQHIVVVSFNGVGTNFFVFEIIINFSIPFFS